MNNLGGVKVKDQRGDLDAKYIKQNTYLGVKYEKHFVVNTDDPMKQYLLDGIPEKLDPRGLKMFWMVNDNAAKNAVPNGKKAVNIDAKKSYLVDGDDLKDTIWIKGDYTWNGVPVGSSTSWSEGLEKNKLITTSAGIRSSYPILGVDYCMGGEEGLGRVVFFGAWESHFLLAEAALRNWNTDGVTDEQAYEDGVRAKLRLFRRF